MKQAQELDDPDGSVPPSGESAGGENMSEGTPTNSADLARLAAEVQADRKRWCGLSVEDQKTALRAEIRGHRDLRLETLVFAANQAFAAAETKLFNLAFEALSKAATPLLLSQAWAAPKDTRPDQAQTILMQVFELMLLDDADAIGELIARSEERAPAVERAPSAPATANASNDCPRSCGGRVSALLPRGRGRVGETASVSFVYGGRRLPRPLIAHGAPGLNPSRLFALEQTA